MLVNLPKHVVKIEIKLNILLCLTETKNYFVVFRCIIAANVSVRVRISSPHMWEVRNAYKIVVENAGGKHFGELGADGGVM